MLIPLGIASYKDASYKDITPDDIIAGRNHTTINKTINESDPIDWYNEGDALFNSGQYNESIEAYNRAIELNKSYTEAWIGEGFALDI